MNNKAIQVLRSNDLAEYTYKESLTPGQPYASLKHNRLYVGGSLSLNSNNNQVENNNSAALSKMRPISTNDFQVYKQDLFDKGNNKKFTQKYLYRSYKDVEENIISNSELTNDNDDVAAFIRVNELNGNLEIRSLVSGTSIGKENQFTGPGMYAIGSRNIIKKGESTVIGNNNVTNGSNSYAIGVGNKVNTNDSIIIGTQSKTVAANDSTGQRIAIGNQCESSGFGSVTIGTYCKATEDGAVAIGYGTEALNDGAFAIGYYTKTNETYATAIGKYNKANPGNLFEIGYGKAGTKENPDINRANVFEVTKYGDFTSTGYADIGGKLHVKGEGLNIIDNSLQVKKVLEAGRGNIESLYVCPNLSAEGSTLIVAENSTLITEGGLQINEGDLNTPNLISTKGKINKQLTIGYNNDFIINEHSLETTKRINAKLFSTVSSIFTNSNGGGVDTNYINMVTGTSKDDAEVTAIINGANGQIECRKLIATTLRGGSGDISAAGKVDVGGNITTSGAVIAKNGLTAPPADKYPTQLRLAIEYGNEINIYNTSTDTSLGLNPCYLNWRGGCSALILKDGTASGFGYFKCGTLEASGGIKTDGNGDYVEIYRSGDLIYIG